MDARRLLQRMCQRHGLSTQGADELAPLIERALVSPTPVRNRILEIIDDNLARRAGGDGTATLESLEADLDEEVLRAVAAKLHSWSPGAGLATFGEGFPDEAELEDASDDLPEGLGGDPGDSFGAGLDDE